jgi:hypothetical protein
MIKIQSASQFTRAADKLRSEPQSVQRHEPGLWRVTNKKKNNTYYVRIERTDLGTFGRCTCEAGTPTNRRSAPMICKHLCAVVMLLRAVRAMKQRALAH